MVNFKKGLVSLLAAGLIAPSVTLAEPPSTDLETRMERSQEQLKGSRWAKTADEILENESIEDHFALKLADHEFFGEDSVYGNADITSRLIELMMAVPGRFKRVQFLGPRRFGKHKKNYKELDWKKFDTRHFSIQAYDKNFIDDFVSLSELSYDGLSKKFNNKFSDLKVQSYIYQTRRDFEQTRFFPGLVPEGLGGFTFIRAKEKNRVVSLFEGDFSDWEHVWKHEYAHWHDFQLIDHVKKVEGRNNPPGWLTSVSLRQYTLPLWLMEGTAEHFSKKWDAADETVIRDAYFNNFIFPVEKLWMIRGSWLMYKEGHFITKYIEENFGHDAIINFRHNLYAGDFEDNVEKTLGISIKELDKRLELYVDKLYSELAAKKDIVDKAFKLGGGRVMAAHDNFFISGRVEGRRSRLYINYFNEFNKLVSEEVAHDRVPGGESLHRFKAGADINKDTIVYPIRSNKSDMLHLLNYTYDKKEKEFDFKDEEAFRFEGIEIIRSPALIDKERTAFIGHTGEGFAQLFLFNKKTGKIEQLTEGRSGYNSLDFNKERNALVFSKEDGSYGTYRDNLYLMDPDTRNTKRLANLPFNTYAPQFSPDGSKVAFVGDKDNVFNLYVYDFNTKRHAKFGDAKVAALSPQWLSDDELLFNSIKMFMPTMHKIKFPGVEPLLHESLEETVDKENKNKGMLNDLEFRDGSLFVIDGHGMKFKAQKFVVNNGILHLQGNSEEKLPKTKLFAYYGGCLHDLVDEKGSLESVLASDKKLKTFFDKFNGEETIVKTVFSDDYRYLGFALNTRMSSVGRQDEDFTGDFPLSFAVYDALDDKLTRLPNIKKLDSTNNIDKMVFVENKLLLKFGEWLVYDIEEGEYHRPHDMYPFNSSKCTKDPQGIECLRRSFLDFLFGRPNALLEYKGQVLSEDGRFIAALGRNVNNSGFDTVYVYDVVKKDMQSYGEFWEDTVNIMKFTSDKRLLFGSDNFFLNNEERNVYRHYFLLEPGQDKLTELRMPWRHKIKDIYVDGGTIITKGETGEDEEKKEHLLISGFRNGIPTMDRLLVDYDSFKNITMADGDAVITAVNEYGSELFLYSGKKTMPWSNIKKAELEKKNLIIYDNKAKQHIINLEDMVEKIIILPLPSEKEKALKIKEDLILPKVEFKEETLESKVSKWPLDSMNIHLIGAVGSGGAFMDTFILTRDELWDRLFLINFTGNFNNFNFGEIGYGDTNNNNLYQLFIRHYRKDMIMGASFTHAWPLSRYSQLDLTGAYEFQDMKYFDYKGKNHALKFNLGAGHDTTVWSRVGPIHGYRFYTNLEVGYSVSENTVSNIDANAGFRYYYTPHELLTLAGRVEAGTSHGLVPSLYLLGGNKTLRGVPFDWEVGNNYAFVGADVRLDLFYVVGAVLKEPLTSISAILMNYDVEVGMYGDVGAAWYHNIYDPRPLDYKQGHMILDEPKWGVGWMLNFTTPFGIRLRFNQGIWGNMKDWNFWIGSNW